jgi:hypothetical protein
VFSLPDCLSTYWNGLLTPIVDTYFLIFNRISSLSTFLFSGAKLLSLYLFRAKMSGKVTKNYIVQKISSITQTLTYDMEKLIKLVPVKIIKRSEKDNLDLDFCIRLNFHKETFRDVIKESGFLIVVSISESSYILRYPGGSIVKVFLEEQP